jgi:hypothetical protein
MDPAGIPALVEAIHHLHGCKATHVETVHVCEMHEGHVAWEGDVEVFRLAKHPKAMRAYAWSEPTAWNKRRFFAVLHTVGVDTPVAAVRASILTDAKAPK